MEIEGTCIHDVVMVESASVAAVKAALSRISHENIVNEKNRDNTNVDFRSITISVN
jgi:hypothetical protein